MSIGWIKLHREIRNHWIYKDPVKFQWWITMLMEVNFSEKKVLIGNKLIDLKKGQSANSLRTWAIALNTSTKTLVNFFELLESDGMIERKTIGKGKQSTTLINITNYDKFQSDLETLTPTLTPTLRKHEGNAKGIQLKKDNKEKEIKEVKKEEPIEKHSLIVWIEKNTPRVQTMKEPISNQQAEKIVEDYKLKPEAVKETLLAMNNSNKLKNYISANSTLRNWIRLDEKRKESQSNLFNPPKITKIEWGNKR
jgi:DNA-binding transcriptional regulator YhcF (GntR family)